MFRRMLVIFFDLWYFRKWVQAQQVIFEEVYRMPKGETDLRQFIKGKLRIQLDEICSRAESYQDSQKGDNIQGRAHCKTWRPI